MGLLLVIGVRGRVRHKCLPLPNCAVYCWARAGVFVLGRPLGGVRTLAFLGNDGAGRGTKQTGLG